MHRRLEPLEALDLPWSLDRHHL